MATQSVLLFDLDGTLIDSRLDLTAAVNAALASFGVAPLSLTTVTGFVGNGVRALMTRAVGNNAVDVDQAIVRMQDHYRQHATEATTLYPGVLATLPKLASLGFRLAILTNKPQARADEVCVTLGLSAYFDSIWGDDSRGSLKPDPWPIRRALAELNCAADTSWMIGDNYTDLAAGRAAAVRRCFCRYGFGQPRTESWDAAIDAFQELLALLGPAGTANALV